jgi:hypothetical protein
LKEKADLLSQLFDKQPKIFIEYIQENPALTSAELTDYVFAHPK